MDREQTTAVYGEDGKVVAGVRGDNAIEDFVSKSGISVYCVAGIREVVEYLFRNKIQVTIRGKRGPIDEQTKAAFDEYLNTYGTV
jgi:hypothetical protein